MISDSLILISVPTLATGNGNIWICCDDLDENMQTLTNIIDNICQPLFKRKTRMSSSSSPDFCSKDAVYIDGECKNLKRYYYKCLNTFRLNPCDDTRIDMVHARKCYKSTVRKKKSVYDKNQSVKLEIARNVMQSCIGKC